MAYAILPKDVSINQLCKIAEDDTEKNSFNIIESEYRIIEISNSDFINVCALYNYTLGISMNFSSVSDLQFSSSSIFSSFSERPIIVRVRIVLARVMCFVNFTSSAQYSFLES